VRRFTSGSAKRVSLHRVNLAIIMPTFKREAYVRRNIRLLNEQVIRHFDGCIQLIVIDNGQTLEAETRPGVRIIHNRNFGGAGGFARGLLEAMQCPEEVTHVLFCDDDILIEPESVRRLYRLLGYLHETTVVGGGMLDMGNKTRLHERGAFLRNMRFNPRKFGHDESQVQSLAAYDLNEAVNYFGWWFFASPLEAFKRSGFPLPYFVRSDDQEFGIRLLKQGWTYVTLLGCAVWHDNSKRRMPRRWITMSCATVI
jgi:galactofuranosylgalactofuranosylrhamnosyl-N-acetylglucosaminyl-diphospho-decaprenol beta-1,5/1,6-galactofuranosyltransferase